MRTQDINKGQGKTSAIILLSLFVFLGIVFGSWQLYQGELSRGLLGLGSILFLAIPPLLRYFGFGSPWLLYCSLFSFCILAYDFGCVLQWFDRLPLLDKISHFLSGPMFTLLGLCLYTCLRNMEAPITAWRERLLWCSYALFFSMFVAVLWETAEFAGFLLTGHDSQHTLTTGVFDTMQDLLCCLLGSLLSAAGFWLSCSCRRKLPGHRIVEQFRQGLNCGVKPIIK